jgi:hypothetical protein
VLVFWVTNNTCSILYLAAARQPAVRNALGLTPLGGGDNQRTSSALGPLGAAALTTPPLAAAAAAAAAPWPPDAPLSSQQPLTSQSVRGAQLQTAATLGSIAAPP